jgi:hypothetical protein
MSFSYKFNGGGYTAGDEVMGDFAVLPEGWYLAKISAMENKESSAPKSGGGFVNLTVEVIGGQYGGAQLFDNLMLWSEDEKVINMTRRKLNTLCLAVAKPTIQDLNELMGPQFYVKVSTQEARTVNDDNTGETKTYNARSQVKTYRSVAAQQAAANEEAQLGAPASFGNGAGAATSATSAPPATTAAASSGGNPFTGGGQQTETAPAEQSKPAATTAPAGNKPPWAK